MMTRFLQIFFALALVGQSAEALTVTRQQAEQAADAMYTPSANFTEAVLKASPKYISWAKSELNDLKKSGISFGSWRVAKQESGNQLFTCSIDSAKAQQCGVSFRVPENTEVILNGEKIWENDKHYQTGLNMFVLDLKKGKNLLELKVVKYNRNFRWDDRSIYPYADPMKRLRDHFWRDYREHMNLLGGETRFLEVTDFRSALEKKIEDAVERSLFSAGIFEKRFNELKEKNLSSDSVEWLKLYDEIVATSNVERTLGFDSKNVIAALTDISKKYKSYPAKYLAEAKAWDAKMSSIKAGLYKNDESAKKQAAEFSAFAREALLANPLLKKHNDWIFIKRKHGTPFDGLPSNWQGNHLLRDKPRWGDEIWKFSITNPSDAHLLFKSSDAPAVTDMCVDWDGKKIMFSSLDKRDTWQLFEIDANGNNLKMVSPGLYDGIDNYNGVYLPSGKIVFVSTACYVGVPCVGGVDYVGNLYTLDPKAGSPEKVDATIRQLTFEQDADWMPCVMNDGRVMYTRWEYTDNSHYFARILMRMNPDGTSQSSYYGSTSFWPNSIFYSRPIEKSATKFVSIVSGHHGTRRSGELHLFDTSNGTIEEQGRVHKFPTYGREYIAKTKDTLVDGVWPQMIHPYPITEDFIVAAIRTPQSQFGICLIDKYDNIVMLQSANDALLFEPMPLEARKRPPVLPDQVSRNLKANPKLDKGNIFLNDIYQGPGLAGVPRGEVKALRVYEYNYTYRNMGAHDVIGQEGSWDVKKIHGTVPVEDDGSAIFEVPANRPIALQPLDKNGKALALMRSWLVVMPGETQSCVGCHEAQYMTPISATAKAARRKPSKIEPFRGPVRGYSFLRDVQPMLDKNCVGCHDGTKPDRPMFKRGKAVWKNFTKSYLSLHPFVRRSGPESNQNLLTPSEFNANTSELVQMLKKGHHGVELDKDSWDILYTWIDLNVPFNGSWKEVRAEIPNNGDKLRMKFMAKYANRFEDPDVITWDPGEQPFVAPKPEKVHTSKTPTLANFPFDEKQAKAKVAAVGLPKELVADLGEGITMRFSLIPAGTFVMGTNEWFYDEGPAKVVKIEKPFYMATFETTNSQYSVFDKNHKSGYLDRHWKDHINRGYPANLPEQSVIRVSWQRANDFCKWLGEKYGLEVSLPTEAQWEWAAKAGSEKDFWFGTISSDYGIYENLSDVTTKKFAVVGIDPQPIRNPSPEMAYVPADLGVDDGELISTNVGSYTPSPFNLYDINGNVAEWTSSDYTETLGGKPVENFKVVRGGSWSDRAKWSRNTLRRFYPPWQRVYNVGFRAVINNPEAAAKVLKKAQPLPAKKITPRVSPQSVVKDFSMYRTDNPKDLIANGGFEFPDIAEGVNMVSRENVPAWETKESGFEIWRGSVMGSPKTDASGETASQHIEIASNGSAPFEVSQTVVVPKNVKRTSATLSFELWQRKPCEGQVFVFVNGKERASKKFEGDANSWTKNTLEVRQIMGGDVVKILFLENSGSLGWHLDNVSFLLK